MSSGGLPGPEFPESATGGHEQAADDYVALVEDPISVDEVTAMVRAPDAGAVAVFLGTVRNHSPGRSGVTHLEYEAYSEQVVPKIAEVVAEARSQWPLISAAAVHRTGELAIGDVSVAVAVSSAHRADAFPAARYIIDELKRRAPIWKKEHWPGGAEWVREDVRHA